MSGELIAPDSQDDAPHVLVVDDEVAARESLGALLEDDYRVTLASSGEDAVRILREHPISVVCTDLQMPGMSGIELLRRLAEVSPRAVGILVTGYPELTSGEGERGRHLVVIKPFTPERLLRIVAQAVSFSRLRAIADDAPPGSGSTGP